MTDTRIRDHLPPGYIKNPPVAYTMESYWTGQKIADAHYYQYQVYAWAMNICRARHYTRLFDFGCGPGIKLKMIHRALPELQIVGVDQPDAIRYCQKSHPFGEWHGVDLNAAISVPGPKADLIICADVIEHLVKPEDVLTSIRNSLSDRGSALVSTPDRKRLRGRTHLGPPPNPSHIQEWSQEEFAALLEDHGFRILDHRHTYAVRWAWNDLWRDEVLKKWARGRSARYAQVVWVENAR